MRTTIAALCVLGLLAGCERKSDRTAGAEADRTGADTMASTAAAGDTAAALQWGPAPPGFPAGGRMAVVDGDPSKPGTFTVRLEAPKGYEVKPHPPPPGRRTGPADLGRLHAGAWQELG